MTVQLHTTIRRYSDEENPAQKTFIAPPEGQSLPFWGRYSFSYIQSHIPRNRMTESHGSPRAIGHGPARDSRAA